jgi:anti-sigma regulatory factor (Ser/Thr protein kinase)
MFLANDIQEVAHVIDRLELFFVEEDIELKEGLRFCLAIDELITNILSYGLVDRIDGEVSLLVKHEDGALHAEIADNGPKFDPSSVETHAPSGSLAEREVGGLGIVLVKAVMDSLEYQHDGGFNRLKVTMKLPAA